MLLAAAGVNPKQTDLGDVYSEYEASYLEQLTPTGEEQTQ